jgi:hypothetical protein
MVTKRVFLQPPKQTVEAVVGLEEFQGLVPRAEVMVSARPVCLARILSVVVLAAEVARPVSDVIHAAELAGSPNKQKSLSSREWQPAITSLVESELDLAGATTPRSFGKFSHSFQWLL